MNYQASGPSSYRMELVEATADDLDAFVERWYDLVAYVGPDSKHPELAYTKVHEDSEDGFRDHLNEDIAIAKGLCTCANSQSPWVPLGRRRTR